ncbi:MAG TPA: sulfite exporter TauE/SafE family protein [Actinomycetota bacterium]|nr:sulfite exporter TauE/SafE family protein [Actinomycetota bacterium]
MVALHPPQVAVLAGAALAAGAVNAVAGGGSLVSFPALLAVGYPAIDANVTNTVALCPGYFGGTLGYRRELSGQRARVRALGATSVVGALLGAFLLVISSPELFKLIVPFLIFLACGLLAVQPWLARLVQGRGRPRRAEHRPVALYGVQFLAAVYGAYFGAGVGIMMLAILGIFLSDSLQRLNALKGLLSLVINVVAAAYFALFAHVAWLAAALMAPAALLGGQVGVLLARRLDDRVLRVLVIAFGVAVGVRLLVS